MPDHRGPTDMPDYKGRIFGRSVLDVRFRAFYGEDLFLGELLAGDDPERGRRYLFRVTDVAYGSESSDEGWAERTAGGLMAMDQVGEATTLRDFEKRLYKVAKVVPLGYVDDAGGFHKPKSLPAQFAAVSAPTDGPGQSLTGKVLDDLAGGKVVLVDTSGLEAVEETLVASLLTRSLLDERATLYRSDRERFGLLPRTLVALEEAQRVLTRLEDAEFNVFPRLAREGRKFNVGLCAVSQQPKLIDPELLSQFNTYFVLGLADERDRNTLRASSKQDLSDLGAEIQTLMPGEALVTNPEAPFALPARVHLYEDWLATVPASEAARARSADALAGFFD